MGAPEFIKLRVPFGTVVAPARHSLNHVNLLRLINAWLNRWDAPYVAVETAFNAATPEKQLAAHPHLVNVLSAITTFDDETIVQAAINATYAALA